MKEDEAVRNALMTLPNSFVPKVSTIENSRDLDRCTMDQLYGTHAIFLR